MKRCLVLAVGRRDKMVDSWIEDYHRRCARWLGVEQRVLRDLAALRRAIPPRGVLVALDERGRQLTSSGFAEQLQRWIEGPAPAVTFIIGGADGLDDELRARADLVLSLGQITIAHRLVRLLLAEQLYRAVSILEGSPYHRG